MALARPLLDPERRPAPSRARHSSSWALKTVLALDGKDSGLSEPLLFGLGAGAWYSWHPQRKLLKGLHPDRIARALLALNVPAFCHRHLDEGVFRQLEERRRAERPVIANLGLHALAGGEPVSAEDDGDFSVVVVSFEGATREASRVHFLSHLSDRVVTRSAAEFARSWFVGEDGLELAGCFIHQSTKGSPLRWDPAFALRQALWQYHEQMSPNRLGGEITGLAALDDILESLEAGLRVPLRSTWKRARADGGAQFHRDLMAAFFTECGDRLGAVSLHDAALELLQSGYLWSRVFALVEEGQDRPGQIIPLLQRIRAAEQEALGHVREAAGESWR
jgi:hypothetical protein